MDTELLIGQAANWLNQGSDGMRVEALIDLPGIDWVHLKALQDRGSLLDLTYRGLSLSNYLSGDVELTCDRTAVRAVRRVAESDTNLDFLK